MGRLENYSAKPPPQSVKQKRVSEPTWKCGKGLYPFSVYCQCRTHLRVKQRANTLPRCDDRLADCPNPCGLADS